MAAIVPAATRGRNFARTGCGVPTAWRPPKSEHRRSRASTFATVDPPAERSRNGPSARATTPWPRRRRRCDSSRRSGFSPRPPHRGRRAPRHARMRLAAPRGDDTVTYENRPPARLRCWIPRASPWTSRTDGGGRGYGTRARSSSSLSPHARQRRVLTPQLMPDARLPPSRPPLIALAERLDVPVDRVITPWALTQTSASANSSALGFAT